MTWRVGELRLPIRPTNAKAGRKPAPRQRGRLYTAFDKVLDATDRLKVRAFREQKAVDFILDKPRQAHVPSVAGQPLCDTCTMCSPASDVTTSGRGTTLPSVVTREGRNTCVVENCAMIGNSNY